MNLARFVRFGIVGVVNTGVYFGLYLQLRMVLPYLVAHVIAFGLAVVGSYFLNCRFTFRVKPSWRSFLLFPLSTLTNFVITTTGLYLLVEHLGFDQRWSALAAAVVAIPITFTVAQFVLTGREHPAADPVEGRARSHQEAR